MATLPGIQLFLAEPAPIASVRSASPGNVLLRGFFARAHTTKQCSFPEAQMLMDLRYLWELANEQRLPINTFAFKSKFWRCIRRYPLMQRLIFVHLQCPSCQFCVHSARIVLASGAVTPGSSD